MSRMVGGTFGVAVLGALVATVGRSQLDRLIPQVPSGKRAELAQVLGSGSLPSGGAVGHTVRQAFVTALSNGLLLSAGVALVGALVAATLISPITASARARARGTEPGAEVASAAPAGEPV